MAWGNVDSMDYTPRAVDGLLDDVMSGLPAVALEGPKGVGKTATARRLARTVLSLDDPDEARLAEIDTSWLTEEPRPVLVDEWQQVPATWDRVRRAVDRGAPPGSYLLTGSATPTERTHSGAGRIVRLRMRPMSMDERGLVEPTVSFGELLGDHPAPVSGRSELVLRDYAEEIAASGFPGMRTLPERMRVRALNGYVARIVDHEFSEVGHVVRRPETLRAWLTAFAAATSSTASYESILNASTSAQVDKPSRSATIAYRDTLARLWLIDQVPAWLGPRRRLASLAQSPKHFLADPALAMRLLGVGARGLLERPHPGKVTIRDGLLLGAMFEHLVALSVLVHAETHEAKVSHLRTKQGDHEVDLIVERDDGKVVAIEVKVAPHPTDHDVKHLRWLKEKLGDDLLDAVVVTTGPIAYRRPEDGIAVVPLSLLGP